MKGEQLDLFHHTRERPMAEIIPFPVDREVMFVRETARILSIRQGASAERFWQMTCRRLYARLQVQGISPDAITLEVRQFANAVYSHMQSPTIHETDPRGAA